MAIQFPNFLSVPVQAKDYSGVGDMVDNFYKGYNMPNDALIKQIQAKFAQPNAEADLKSTQLRNAYQSILNQYAPESQRASIESTRLGNRKSQMDIDKLALELQQERELENQLRTALNAAGAQGSAPMPTQPQASSVPPIMPTAPMMPQAPAGLPPLPGVPKGIPIAPPIPGMTMAGSAPLGTQRVAAPVQTGAPVSIAPNAPMNQANAPTAPNVPAAAAVSEAAPQPLQEVVVAKGAPQLAGVDQMYDSNPVSRAFLEKKGYKKTQEVKFDNKTGRTTIITKYPSGKVTVQASPGAPASPEGIPLTNRMITQHQQMISAIDNAKPVIQEIIDQKGFNPYPRWTGLVPGSMGQSATYDTLVKSALDTLIKAYGLPSTNEGIATVKDQLLIHHGETADHYRARLKNLVKDLDRRKAYSEGQVKKSNSIQPVDTSASGVNPDNDSGTYSSDDWEAV